MRTIEIKKDVRIPGTNIILERGDKILVKEAYRPNRLVYDDGDSVKVWKHPRHQSWGTVDAEVIGVDEENKLYHVKFYDTGVTKWVNIDYIMH